MKQVDTEICILMRVDASPSGKFRPLQSVEVVITGYLFVVHLNNCCMLHFSDSVWKLSSGCGESSFGGVWQMHDTNHKLCTNWYEIKPQAFICT